MELLVRVMIGGVLLLLLRILIINRVWNFIRRRLLIGGLSLLIVLRLVRVRRLFFICDFVVRGRLLLMRRRMNRVIVLIIIGLIIIGLFRVSLNLLVVILV